MTERDLIKKLNSLKSIQPDSDWKINNRDILFSQLKNTTIDSQSSGWSNFWMLSGNFFASVPQFAWVSISIVLFLATSLIWGNKLPVGPNNSLYIAKMISEKAKLNTTFNETNKNRLTAKYASEHAKDIVSVLTDPNFDINNEAEVSKLNENFKNEIAKFKNNLPALKIVNNNDGGEELLVSIAEADKTDSGVTVFNPSDNNDGGIVDNDSEKSSTTDNSVEKTGDEDLNLNDELTLEGEGLESTEVAVETPKDPKVILEEAEKMFSVKDYSGALDKLKEVDEIIK